MTFRRSGCVSGLPSTRSGCWALAAMPPPGSCADEFMRIRWLPRPAPSAGAAGIIRLSPSPEAVDRERLDGCAVASDDEAVGCRSGVRPIQLDDPAGELLLRQCINGDRIGDRRQRRWCDRWYTSARNVKRDRVRSGVSVGVENGLAQRARAAVVGVRDDKCRRPSGDDCRGFVLEDCLSQSDRCR